MSRNAKRVVVRCPCKEYSTYVGGKYICLVPTCMQKYSRVTLKGGEEIQDEKE